MALVLASGLTVSACDPEPGPDPVDGQPAGPAVSLRLGFTQLLPEEGTDRGLLRVVNAGPDPVDVTGIGLSWSGYGGPFGQAKDVTIDPGRTVDLKLTLPHALCGRAADPVVGRVSTSAGEVSQPLTPEGTTYLRRLWTRQCTERLVARRVEVAYASRWQQQGTGPDAQAVGALRLTRRQGAAEIRLTGLAGSVLYDVRLGEPRSLPRERRAALVPVRLLPGNRCDEHARGQATAPFDFLLRLRIGDGPVLAVAAEPPPAGQRAATRMLDRACG